MRAALVTLVTVVPSGVAEVAKLQFKEGFACLRP